MTGVVYPEQAIPIRWCVVSLQVCEGEDISTQGSGGLEPSGRREIQGV